MRRSYNQVAGGILLGAVVALASLYNLANYPTIWWDEAIFSETAANLVQHGRYAFTVQSPDQLSDLDYRISVGPMVILPTALAYRLLGVGLTAGRLVAGAYLILAFLALFLAARRLWGPAAALLAVALALVGTDALYWGRSVMGDLPALGLFLLGTWFVLKALEKPAAWPLLLGGFFLGLAFNAKEFYALTVLPPVILLAAQHWHNPRRLLVLLAAFGGAAAIPPLAYLALKVAILGSLPAAVVHFLEQKALLKHEFFTPLTIGRVYPESFAFLLGHPLFWLGFLGFYGDWKQNGWSPGKTLWLLYFILWSLVYLTAVYWHRFALPALFLACAPGAHFLRQVWVKLSSHLPSWAWKGSAASILAAFVLICYPLVGVDILGAILGTRANAPERLRHLLDSRVSIRCLIETPEYELAFLDDDHHIHLMPAYYFVESTHDQVVLLDPRTRKYDFEKTGADLLILGSFGKSVFKEVYAPARLAQNWRKVGQVDFYDIYVRRGREKMVWLQTGRLLAHTKTKAPQQPRPFPAYGPPPPDYLFHH